MGDTARPRTRAEGEETGGAAARARQEAPGPALPARARPAPRLSPVALQRLGRTAGNRAVTALVSRPASTATPSTAVGGVVSGGSAAIAEPFAEAGPVVQRYAGLAKGGGSYAPPAPPVPPDPKGDAKFMKVAGALKAAAKETKKHPKGKAEAQKASKAAKAPPTAKDAFAKADQTDKMAGAKKGTFDKAAFIAAVKKAIASAAPKDLDEADKFAESGKADGVKTQVMDKVAKGKDDSSKDIDAKAKESPDPTKVPDKPVEPLPNEKVDKPRTPDFKKAMPEKVPAEQTNFDGPKNETADKLKEANVSEADLKKSNEPQMMAAVDAKKEADEHSAKAPAEIRKKEAEALKKAEAGADQKGVAGAKAMLGAKKDALGKAMAKKNDQKSKEETKRAEVAAELNKIYDRTKLDVEKTLTDLDTKVSDTFTSGEARVRQAFTAQHKSEMQKFKDDRYSGAGGAIQWGLDLFNDLNEMPEVKAIYTRAVKTYTEGMERVISDVADVVGKGLDAAKSRIDSGRKEIKDWVAKQPKDVQKLANDAAKDMDEKFKGLESQVDEKSESLANDLAEKYTAALGEVNKEVEAAQAENRSAWSKAKEAVGGAIEAILKLKDLFMGMLSKAAGAFKAIVADPLKFIGNFMNAVKTGFMNFVGKIKEYLKSGLKEWLFGKLSEGGIEIPDKLDLPGILKMVLSVLGLTWANIRPRIVKVVGEKAMAFLEGTAEVFVILAKEGIAGLWKWLLDKVGDLKEMVLGKIKDFVIEKIVKAGITWVLGMLNPAGALIKIVTTLISVIQWIMEKGGALVELVGTVIDAVSDIARGGMGGVPAKIEGALARAVPIVISFLASLLGLGGIGDFIKKTLQSVQAPVMRGVDAVIAGVVKVTKPIWGPIKKGVGKVKDAATKVKDAAKKKLEQGKKWVKDKATAAKDWVKGKLFKKPFAMKGTSHTLTVDPSAGADVIMASAPERLGVKVGRAIGAVKRKLDKQDSPKLKQRLKDLQAIGNVLAEVRQLGIRDRAKGSQPELNDRLARLGELLQAYGDTYGVTDLDPNLDRPERAEQDEMAEKKLEFLWRDPSLPAPIKRTFLDKTMLRAGANAAERGLWQAMKDVVNSEPGTFLLKGKRLGPDDIKDFAGTMRAVDLGSVFRYMLEPGYKSRWGDNLEAWLDDLRANPRTFDPNTHIRDDAALSAAGSVGWWNARAQANGLTIGELVKDLALQESWKGRYENGAVRFTIDPGKAAAMGFFRPTVLDGINFGQHYVPASGEMPHNWGVTEQKIAEAVADVIKAKDTTGRTLYAPAPKGTPAPAAGPASAGTAPSLRPGGTGPGGTIVVPETAVPDAAGRANGPGRQGMERGLPPPSEVGLPGEQRSHAAGPGTGEERREGISYAPSAVNLSLMNQGVEPAMRDLADIAPAGVTISKQPIVKQQGHTARLEWITYKIYAQRGPAKALMAEVTIKVDRTTTPPKVLRPEVEMVGELAKHFS